MHSSFERHHIDCQCTSMEHSLRFTLDTLDGDLWLEVHLSQLPWYKRIFAAIKYIFGIKDHRVQFEETILCIEDYEGIKTLFDRSRAIKTSSGDTLINQKHSNVDHTLAFELNCREAKALAHVVGKARYGNCDQIERESHDGVHTVYPKIMDAYEKLVNDERPKKQS
jgi:hypothetical protein